MFLPKVAIVAKPLRELYHDLTVRCSASGRTSTYIYTVPRILRPWNRLKVICLKKPSMLFLLSLVNRARKTLVYRWRNPKCCSTM